LTRRAIALAAVALAGCGGGSPARDDAADGPRPDDAFVVRVYAQQQTGAQVVRGATGRLRDAPVRKLARQMSALRRRELAAIAPHRRRAGAPEQLATLGVSRRQAAEDIGPTALDGVQPLTPAFLAVMARHDQGVIALARAELARGRVPAVKALARRLMIDHTRELDAINRTLARVQQTA
jgi:uncharacterized protein (DUF305 family)